MLTHLSIHNVAIADHLEIELDAGMTVVTGETGAGKSIMLDALGLALGDRADAGMVRQGAPRADILASFDLGRIEGARQWLEERELASGDECVLRRVINADGRSRGFINGRPATLQDLRALGEFLVDIHGQHAHQSLLRRSHQRDLLDAFAGQQALAAELRQRAREYQQRREQLASLESGHGEQLARAQLLSYQVGELDQLDLSEDELARLEQEQQQLANGEAILQHSQHALALCSEGEINVSNILQQALRSLEAIDAPHAALAEATEMLGNALIQVDEAARTLSRHVDDFELDPERLVQVEQRLGAIYDIARKHRISPADLPRLHRELQTELAGISGGDATLERLRGDIRTLQVEYDRLAAALGKARARAATALRKAVEQQLKALAMGNCRFEVALTPREDTSPHPAGREQVEFLISTNPGSPPQALSRVASGGELSRISLAIQVIAARNSAIPTLVFDEVDVGISGATAEVVGNLLQELGERGQVLCVTHQPQVASKGHQHLRVSKSSDARSVRTTVSNLEADDRIEELARMLGGLAITEQTRAHAREMVTLTH